MNCRREGDKEKYSLIQNIACTDPIQIYDNLLVAYAIPGLSTGLSVRKWKKQELFESIEGTFNVICLAPGIKQRIKGMHMQSQSF